MKAIRRFSQAIGMSPGSPSSNSHSLQDEQPRSVSRHSGRPFYSESRVPYTAPFSPGGTEQTFPETPSPSDLPRQRRESTTRAREESIPPVSGHRRKSEDRLKRSRQDSSAAPPTRNFAHEVFSLQPVQEPRPSSPTVRARESRLKLKTDNTSKSALIKEKEQLTARVYELQDQLRTFEDSQTNYEAKTKALEESLQRTNSRYRLKSEDLDALKTSSKKVIDEAARQVQDLKARNQRLEGHIQKLQTQVNQFESQHSQTTALLNVRTAELKGAQTFLSKADQFSGGDVIRLVEALNSEIFQCCAFVAETVMSEEKVVRDDERLVAGWRKEISSRFGERLVTLLERNYISSRDPLPLQIALQITLVLHCIQILTMFDPNSEPINARLTHIYEQVLATEEQAVAGRWRAITMAQLHVFETSQITVMTQTVLKMAFVAGWSRQSRRYEHVVSSIQARLHPIEKAVLRLKQAVSEGITSADVIPFFWPPGHLYDGGVDMEDLYPDEAGGVTLNALKGVQIVGTVEMGVNKVTMVRLHDGTVVRKKDILAKPKVVLVNTLEEITESTAKSLRSMRMSESP